MHVLTSGGLLTNVHAQQQPGSVTALLDLDKARKQKVESKADMEDAEHSAQRGTQTTDGAQQCNDIGWSS